MIKVNINSIYFEATIDKIYPKELHLDEASSSDTEAPFIMQTYLIYNFDPLEPHFYLVKLGFTRVYIIFLSSAQKRRLWVPVRTASSRRF